ncbi:MAG: hypothetical protein QF511_10515 [Rhodospirillales bacterium]|nr:hypothetical protein [Rhodospirillales bacterium]HIJ93479.1 hypothetical protein [Rhodospirillaceae bacterium]
MESGGKHGPEKNVVGFYDNGSYYGDTSDDFSKLLGEAVTFPWVPRHDRAEMKRLDMSTAALETTPSPVAVATTR